ncbi:heavy metal sensor histidine kinase [Acidovorax sp. PRC11]|jgi:two-component system heavy metal sensor histidine kinase CusS|uniref:heavy metal sensor histidine kinase n=1 Tax=Comamonadaceae TaxID=80864 RepID=UPI002882863F|nr:heavy metal sensor histidine kinase [Acidovorax sp. PRC11]MDT0136965.1 heavy metal sensor histidine kinase [Acidovorax sp. PRC11]
MERALSHSLRQRLSWWLAAQSLAGLGGVCLVVYLVTAMNMSERQAETLAQKETIVRHLLGTGEHAARETPQAHPLSDFLIGHEDFRLTVRTSEGKLLFPLVEPEVRGTNVASKIFDVAGRSPGDPALRVTLSMDVADDQKHLQRLAVTLTVAAVVGTLVVSLGGLSIVHLGLAPVRRLAAQVQALSVENLHQRLDASGQPSELVPLVQQFNDLLGRLDQAYTQLEGFNADVAHELCTPLATLLASNELALRRPASFDLPEVLSSNLEELHRLTGIVNDMLFLSQADRGAAARRTHTPSLAAVVQQVAEYHDAALSEAELELRVSGDAAGDFDEPLLRRALSNLIGNATRYAARGTEIVVSIEPVASGRVRVLVRNTGQTVPAEVLERIFDRFFRASASRTHSQKNHGLGLAITAAIARMHGGGPIASSSQGITSIGLEMSSSAHAAGTSS